MMGSFFVPTLTLQTFMMLIGKKKWMMEEEWTKVRTTRSKGILFSLSFRYSAVSFPSSIYKLKCPQCMLKPSTDSCEVSKYFTHPSSLVKSSSSYFLSIYALFSERFILWVHLVDRGWFLNGAKTGVLY